MTRSGRTRFGIAAGGGFGLLLALGALIPAPAAFAADAAPGASAAPDPDEFLIVDCRLPGRVRKLGTQMVYQMAGSVVRTAARDCSIRGGEYTLLDPSKYADAVKLWLPDAQAGDVKAQTNIGMLYEKASPPDYAQAASWYGKAANANYAPAQTALGHLYEAGLGVPVDKVKAINLYRQAAGLNDRLLQFIDTGDSAAGAADTPQLNALKQQLQDKERQIEELRRSLQRLQSRPSNSSPSAADRQQIDSLQKRIATLESQRAPAAPASLSSLPPPSIEIVYPLATRGGDRIDLRLRAEKGAGDVIGRVHSALGVKSLTVGGKPVTVDEQQLFVVPADLLSRGGATRIDVTDLLGRSSGVELQVARPQAAAPRSGGSGGAIGLKNYYALIIGDDDFKFWPRIDNAVGDARAIEEELRLHYGFKTTLLTNATRQQILGAFNDLRQKMTADDNLLVYYAGHGQLVRQIDRGYWIPVDAQVNSDDQWILNEQITDYLQIIPARHIIVIADSCYAGVLTRSSVQVPKSGLDPNTRLDVLRELTGKRVRTVMTSGGVQPVLDSGANNHSVFAAALLKILRGNDEILEGNRLFDAVSPIVTAQSAKLGYKQTPTYRAIVFAGHEGGDFLFVPGRS